MTENSDSEPITMRLAIVGSRNFTDQARFDTWIKEAIALPNWGVPAEVVSGGARGADTLGERWARANSIPVTVYTPDWMTHGKAAGPIRNRDIINRATHVLAFPSHQGKGTQNSIELAVKQNKKLITHWIDDPN